MDDRDGRQWELETVSNDANAAAGRFGPEIGLGPLAHVGGYRVAHVFGLGRPGVAALHPYAVSLGRFAVHS
jgi:hypothetical protein